MSSCIAGGHLDGTIADRIRRANGDPVPGARVLITGDSPPHADIADVTGARGEYRSTDLLPGRYTVAVHFGERVHTAHVEISPTVSRASISPSTTELFGGSCGVPVAICGRPQRAEEIHGAHSARLFTRRPDSGHTS